MNKFQWITSFATGVQAIDADHRQLLALADAIGQAVARSDADETRERLDAFIALSQGHFSREEAFLERVAWPGLADHKRYHRRLLGQAEELRRSCDAAADAGVPACYEEIAVFLIDDILRGDNAFKSFIEHHGHGSPG